MAGSAALEISSSQQAAAPSTVPRPAEKLAIYGGPRAVRKKYRERWRHVRISDIAPALPYLAIGRNTMSTGILLRRFEREFSDLVNCNYAIMMNSGTSALHSAFFAVGVGPGDEVIVPTYTFFASAAPVLQCGGTPVFCDIDERTLCADPDDVERRITAKTRAICVVHIWGNPAAMDRFAQIARQHNVALIEDASHAHGATYQGQPVGSFGDVGCFSMQGSKAVTGGEAGVAVTNDPVLHDRMLTLGQAFRERDYVADQIHINGMSLGTKYRPHLCAIAMASRSLKRLAKLNKFRRRNYAILSEELADCQAVRPIETYPSGERGGMLDFSLRFHPEHAAGWTRGSFIAASRAEGVKIDPDRYTMQSSCGGCLHQFPMFNDLSEWSWARSLSPVRFERPPREAHFPVAEKLANELMMLPPHTKVSEAYLRQTARALKKVAAAAQHIRDWRTGDYAD